MVVVSCPVCIGGGGDLVKMNATCMYETWLNWWVTLLRGHKHGKCLGYVQIFNVEYVWFDSSYNHGCELYFISLLVSLVKLRSMHSLHQSLISSTFSGTRLVVLVTPYIWLCVDLALAELGTLWSYACTPCACKAQSLTTSPSAIIMLAQ